MKSLIVYSSQSGNTKKLAQAVYESLTGEKEMVAVAEAPDPAGYDLSGRTQFSALRPVCSIIL